MKKALALLLAVVMVLSMAACGSKTASAPTKNLTVIISSDPANMDPADSDEQTHFQVTRQIYETLFIYDEDYNLKNWLCESYEYEDDCTLILHIRKGVKFHNGDELKASDVLFSFKRIVEGNFGGGMVQIPNIDIDKCEVLDDYTLKYVTKVPSATQLNLFEGPSAAILSERAYNEAKGDFSNGAAVGTGPYKFVSYTAGDKTELEAFSDYWREGEPKCEKLTIRVVSDSSSRATEALSHTSDLVYDINATDLKAINDASGVSIMTELGTNTSYLLFNTAMAPMDNELVRQAIWYALDVNSIVTLAYGDFGAVASGWVCPGILGYDAAAVTKYVPQQNIEKAKQLLAEAGYADGLDVEIAVQASNQQRVDMAVAIQAQLKEIGINVTLNSMESGTWTEYITSGKHMMTIYGFSCADFEADRALNQLMPNHTNFDLCSYDNADFQAAISEAAGTIDKEARGALYVKAENMLLEDCVTLPLWHKALPVAVQDGVTGFSITRSYENHYLQTVDK